MIKVVGTFSTEEAKKAGEKYTEDVRKSKKRSFKMAVGFFILCFLGALFLSCLYCWDVYVPFYKEGMHFWTFLATTAVGKECFFETIPLDIIFAITAVWLSIIEVKSAKENIKRPLAYEYFLKTDGKDVLNISFCRDSLETKCWLCLELDNNGKVETEKIFGFKYETRTDIEETVIDVKNGIILEPYSELLQRRCGPIVNRLD